MIPFFLIIIIVISINIFILFLRISIGRQIAKESIPFQHLDRNAKYKALFAGDSTAVGTGAKSPNDSIAGRFYKDNPSFEVINIGKNGLKTSELIPLLKQQKEKFDLVIIQIGGNDILGLADINDLSKEINTVLKLSKSLSNKVVLITAGNVGLAPFFPKPFNFLYTQKTKEVRNVFIQAAKKEQVYYIDLYKNKEDDIFSKNPSKFYAKDMLHPNSEGYRIWYMQLKKTIDKMRLVGD